MLSPSIQPHAAPRAPAHAGAAVLRRLAAARAGRDLLGAPFDLLRLHYASLVAAGWIRRSLLSSARLERTVDALENLVLGPLARQR